MKTKRTIATAVFLAGLTMGCMLFATPRNVQADHAWYARPVAHDDGFSFRVGKVKFSLWGGGPRYVYYPAPHCYVERPVYVDRWGYDRPLLIREPAYSYW